MAGQKHQTNDLGGDKHTKNLPELRVISGEVVPTLRIGPLSQQRFIRKELGKVYRQVRRGEIPADEGSKMTYMLSNLSKILAAEELENRIDTLEKALEQHHDDRR